MSPKVYVLKTGYSFVDDKGKFRLSSIFLTTSLWQDSCVHWVMKILCPNVWYIFDSGLYKADCTISLVKSADLTVLVDTGGPWNKEFLLKGCIIWSEVCLL